MKKIRFRIWFMTGGGALVLAALALTDPDRGMSSTVVFMLKMASAVLILGLAHGARKAFLDYPESDMQVLFRKAREESTGAGLALVAIAIILYGLLALFGRAAYAQDVRTWIPPAADQYRLTLVAEQRQAWPDHPAPELLPALVEHESCVSLRHNRCWNPASRLKSAREEGAGLGQITRAYRTDGTLRFDALQEMRDRHPVLRELDWTNVYQRPDLQLRALVLKSRDNFQALRMVTDPLARLHFADAAYNGGITGVQAERRACGLATGCDPQQWFGQVERHCLKSRAALYGQRSACDINRFHVHDVVQVRAPKYRGWL